MQRTTSRYSLSTYQQLLLPTTITCGQANLTSSPRSLSTNIENILPNQQQPNGSSTQGKIHQVWAKKKGKFTIDWKSRKSIINCQPIIHQESGSSLDSSSSSHMSSDSSDLNPEDSHGASKWTESKLKSLFCGLPEFRIETKLGRISIVGEKNPQDGYKLILDYLRLYTSIKYVEMTCRHIDIRSSPSSAGHQYRLGHDQIPACVDNLFRYCLWVLRNIRQISLGCWGAGQSEIVIPRNQKILSGGFKHQYVFEEGNKKIELEISEQGQAMICIYRQGQAGKELQEDRSQQSGIKLLQVHKFMNLQLLTEEHHRRYLTATMGQTLFAKLLQIYTNYWFLYVSDL